MITGAQFIATIIGLFGCWFAIRVVNDADKHAKERDGLRAYVEEWTEALYGSRKNV